MRLLAACLFIPLLLTACAPAETSQAQAGLDAPADIEFHAPDTPQPTPTSTPEMTHEPTATPNMIHQTPAGVAPLSAIVTPKPTLSPEPSPDISGPAMALKNVNNEKGYVLAHDVNLRQGPGTEHPIVGVLDYHTKLVITAKTTELEDIWYRVTIGDKQGFMLKSFVGLGDIPTPTPTPKPTPKATAKPKATPKPTEKPAAIETPEQEESIPQGDTGDYSSGDIYLAAKLIYAEGKDQSTSSFKAMANVLYNRCASRKFGGTVTQEVYRSGQFTVVTYDSFEGLTPSSKAITAAEAIFNGGERVLPSDVMFFRASRSSKSWGSRTYYKTIGGNDYYS